MQAAAPSLVAAHPRRPCGSAQPSGRPAQTTDSAIARSSRRTARLRLHATESDSATDPESASSTSWTSSPPFLQRLAAASTPVDVFQACVASASASRQTGNGQNPGSAVALSAAECEAVLLALVQLRQVPLALSTFQLFRSPVASDTAQLARWPPLGATGAAALARALCRALAVPQALAVVAALCWGPVGQLLLGSAALSPSTAGTASAVPSLSFGFVVRCPHCAATASGGAVPSTTAALTLVQPQDGCKRAACATCGYDFEIFSGEVTNASSQALAAGESALTRLTRSLGIAPPAGAVHELTVASPNGQQRAFRVGTTAADVPGRVGQRVSVASAAPREPGAVPAARGRDRLISRVLPPIPPRSRPGQALEVSNHTTGGVTPVCVPPPPSAVNQGPSFGGAMPALLALAALGDGASALVDPALPGILLAGAAVSAASVAASDAFLLPQIARLPAGSLGLERIRQDLLAQHAALSAQAGQQAAGAGDDVRTLGRLWQLAHKMEAMAEPQMYGARLNRVTAARQAVEARLEARLALLERYARVASMIEIEVELDADVAPAELTGAAAGIAAELAALEEAQQVADVWRNAAEAADEVERLLSSSGA